MSAPNHFNTIHLIRQVDLFTLRLYLSVVEEGQVGRAAAREAIAASAATKRIQDLEEIVGTRLFDRNSRGVTPTAAGMVLARHLRQVFATFEDVRREIGEFSEGVRGQVRVAAPGGIISQYLSREVAEFARTFPLVELDLREGMNPDVIRSIVSGEVDVAVFVDSKGVEHNELELWDYRIDRLVAVVPNHHPLCEKRSVKLMDLIDHNFIALSASTNIMTHVRQTAALAGIDFKAKYTVNSVYAAAGLVRTNQGVTIQPESLLSAQDLEFVRTIALDESWAQRRLAIGAPKNKPRNLAIQNFISQLTSRPHPSHPAL